MVISFHDDYPIHALYKRVLLKLEALVVSKASYISEYEKYKKIANHSHNPEDRQCAYLKYLKMNKIVVMLEDESLIRKYKERLLPIVCMYRDNQGNGYVFGMNSNINVPKRVSIIISFMKAVNEFAKIEWKCSFNMNDICPACFSYMETRSSVMFCTKCKSTFAINPSEGKSIDIDDIPKESTYKSSKNYKKEFMHLCGLQHSCEVDEVDNIRSHLYRSDCKDPTRSDIRLAIPRCGYKNYNDTNYIYTAITKEDLPPISQHIAACTDRFEKYYEEFDRTYSEGNITNLHFLTKLFLFQENVHTDDDWFRKLSDKTENRHRENATRIVGILAERYPNDNWVVPPEWSTG
jgi:hypothetical protein